MATNILVTGGAGYIGSHTCKALAAAGYCPVTLDNLVHGHRRAVRWGPLVRADLGDRERLLQVLDDFEIEAVVHFAAYAYVGESMREPAKYFRNNVANTLTLLESMQAVGVKQIVFSSTCATYGIPETLPITETSPQRPVNPYGESKLMVERILEWTAAAHGLQWMALRYFNAAGADPDVEIGEDHDPETHLIPLAIDAALGRRAELSVYGTDYPTPDGTAVRDYVHVTDLADGHVRALAHLRDGGASGALNLGTGMGHSVREVVEMVERISGRKVATRDCARREGDPSSLVAAAERAREVLGWQPGWSTLQQIVETAWVWHSREARFRKDAASLAA
jgi:UDP-arabinose 4-epimerase